MHRTCLLLVGLVATAATAQTPFPLERGTPAASVSPHGDIDLTCETCHTADGWTPVRDPLAFNHDRQTGFPLGGRHLQADCASCHLGLRFDEPQAAPADCATCHADVHLGALGADCQTCHTLTDFRVVDGEEIHARTAFPLTGSHLQVDCRTCHAGGAGGPLGAAFGPIPSDCIACHAADYAATAGTTLDHAAAGLPTTCETCHSTVSFGAGGFEHVAASGGFPLVGAHVALPCSSCHTPSLGPLYDPTSADDCLSCHADDAAAARPDHQSFPTTCTTCHTTSGWPGATVDHPAVSGGFSLVGAHMTLDCATCHSGLNYEVPWTPVTQNDCVSCHAEDAEAAQPNHQSFPATCTTCHMPSAWQGAIVDHPGVSGGFTLVGAHVALDCAACHSGPTYEVPWTPSTDADCVSCHAEDADAVQPPHDSFPTTCSTCHSTDAWGGAAIDHPTVSGGFALVGAHLATDCAACHSGPNYEVPWTPAGDGDCLSCHAEDASVAQPDHQSFPTTCTTCHGVDAWQGAAVDHPAVSGGFALVGAHISIDCAACHTGPSYEVPWDPANDADCVSCHAEDAGAAQPPHDSFPTTCTTCHTTGTWQGATIDHPAVSGGFALVGAHVAIECQACHSGPDYSVPWAPAGDGDCVSCHAQDATEAQPPHDTFPTTCTACHGVDTWQGATVDHPAVSSGFALVGAHVAIDCVACHSGPDYQVPWTPTSQDDCISCHEPDYQDQHAGTGFPTTCLTCHTTTTWDGAAFTHDAFPIYSGKHAGEWADCQTCHEQPGDFMAFTCLTCHEHRQSEADDEHSDVTGYVYESTACYSCHPNGEKD